MKITVGKALAWTGNRYWIMLLDHHKGKRPARYRLRTINTRCDAWNINLLSFRPSGTSWESITYMYGQPLLATLFRATPVANKTMRMGPHLWPLISSNMRNYWPHLKVCPWAEPQRYLFWWCNQHWWRIRVTGDTIMGIIIFFNVISR